MSASIYCLYYKCPVKKKLIVVIYWILIHYARVASKYVWNKISDNYQDRPMNFSYFQLIRVCMIEFLFICNFKGTAVECVVRFLYSIKLISQ